MQGIAGFSKAHQENESLPILSFWTPTLWRQPADHVHEGKNPYQLSCLAHESGHDSIGSSSIRRPRRWRMGAWYDAMQFAMRFQEETPRRTNHRYLKAQNRWLSFAWNHGEEKSTHLQSPWELGGAQTHWGGKRGCLWLCMLTMRFYSWAKQRFLWWCRGHCLIIDML